MKMLLSSKITLILTFPCHGNGSGSGNIYDQNNQDS